MFDIKIIIKEKGDYNRYLVKIGKIYEKMSKVYAEKIVKIHKITVLK